MEWAGRGRANSAGDIVVLALFNNVKAFKVLFNNLKVLVALFLCFALVQDISGDISALSEISRSRVRRRP